MAVGDAVEIAGYFIFFWAFIFNSKFRRAQIQEWKASGFANRFFMIIEVLISVFCGVFVPGVFIYLIVKDLIR